MPFSCLSSHTRTKSHTPSTPSIRPPQPSTTLQCKLGSSVSPRRFVLLSLHTQYRVLRSRFRCRSPRAVLCRPSTPHGRSTRPQSATAQVRLARLPAAAAPRAAPSARASARRAGSSGPRTSGLSVPTRSGPRADRAGSFHGPCLVAWPESRTVAPPALSSSRSRVSHHAPGRSATDGGWPTAHGPTTPMTTTLRRA